ncbi:MAG TPA: T9SS type A sorting domain-containing protein [Bacteroidia bacterium]|nr:T9SS type A sorting domain-containing protein [Bacteroidia bacterium]
MRNPIRVFLLAAVLQILVYSHSEAQCFDCGTGADGAFHATVDTTLAGGQHNFSTFSIDAGVTVRVTGSVPLQIAATGAVSINGTLDVSGLHGADGVTFAAGGLGAIGVAGGGDGGGGSYSANNGPIVGGAGTGPGVGGVGDGWSGGGGAGYAAVGFSSGGVGGLGGPSYGTPDLAVSNAGSGGGGGSGGYQCGAGGGGAGGGYVYIGSCASITVSGTINANGGNGGSDGTGNCGGGGGGSGGSIWLACNLVNVTGSISAIGGNGGASAVSGSPYFGTGGSGAMGRIRIDATTYSGSGTVMPASGYSGQVGSPIAVAFSTSDITCNGLSNGMAVATATGGSGALSYLWSPGGSTGDSLTGLAAGCYVLVVSDTAGCVQTDTVCVTEPSPLTLATQTVDASCNGDCNGSALITANGGTPGYQYLWSNGAFGDSIAGLCAGTATVTVTDANGCSSLVSVTVSEPTALALSETHTNATFGLNDGSGTVVATGGTPGYTYLWSPGGQTTATAVNLAPATYTVVVTDTNGCSDTISVVISELVGAPDPMDMQVSLYPNPAKDMVRLSLQQAELSGFTVDLLDLQGKLVASHQYAASAAPEAMIDISELSAGTYLCRITTGSRVVTRKLAIQ